MRMSQTQPLQTILILAAKGYGKGKVRVLGRERGGTPQPAHRKESPGGCLLNWASEGTEYKPVRGWRWGRGGRNGREQYIQRPRSKRECGAFTFRGLQVV